MWLSRSRRAGTVGRDVAEVPCQVLVVAGDGDHGGVVGGEDTLGDKGAQAVTTGIIPYVLTGDERHLDLRAFPEDIKMEVWEKQGHICPLCGKEFDFEFMEGDHIKPWREGGRTVIENCQMLCRDCNRKKGAK